MTDTWWEYVLDVSQKAGPAEIEEQTGIPSPTVSRWSPDAKGGPARPSPDNVTRFARGYRRSPLEALISAGYICRDDLNLPIETPVSMGDVSDDDLLKELAGRLAELRGLQLGGNDSKDGLPPHWGRQDPGVGRMQDGDEGG